MKYTILYIFSFKKNRWAEATLTSLNERMKILSNVSKCECVSLNQGGVIWKQKCLQVALSLKQGFNGSRW